MVPVITQEFPCLFLLLLQCLTHFHPWESTGNLKNFYQLLFLHVQKWNSSQSFRNLVSTTTLGRDAATVPAADSCMTRPCRSSGGLVVCWRSLKLREWKQIGFLNRVDMNYIELQMLLRFIYMHTGWTVIFLPFVYRSSFLFCPPPSFSWEKVYTIRISCSTVHVCKVVASNIQMKKLQISKFTKPPPSHIQ